MDVEKILAGLNSDQRAAVLHNHETGAQLLILAGAGSGKTSVLTKRIQYRILCDVIPEKILALTFTAKAAAEMRERVQKMFPEAGVRLCTFHSLALYMLRQKVGGRFAYEMVGFTSSPVPMEAAEKGFLQEMAKLGIRDKGFSREELFSDSIPQKLSKKLEPLRKRVLESGQVVFEDLIYQAIHLLENHEEARNFFQEQWLEILVDEYQDINPSQYRLVKALLGDRKSLFVVGDDDQAIYGFRGADIGNINRFRDDFKQSTLIRLEWNYRSVPNILYLANDIFENKPIHLRKVLRAGNMSGSGGSPLYRENRKPEVWVSENPVEEMLRIIGCIKLLRESYDLRWQNFAILVRYNRQRLYYEKALQSAGLPVAGVEMEDGETLEEGIHVETVHASKGLQYAVVFYAGMSEGLTPGKCTGNHAARKRQMDEERRLFYVGVTRAESYLVLLYCKRRFWKGKLSKLKRSRFLPKNSSVADVKMPLFIFKIYVIVMVAFYMFVNILKLPFVMLVYRKDFKIWVDKKIQSFARFCMKVLRIDLTIEDQAMLAKVDWSRTVFVMSNHNSFCDIPVAFLALQRTIGFIAKKELSMVPFLSFWMRQIGCVFIDRLKKGGADLIRKAVGEGSGHRIFIFPEGTRGHSDSMVAFKTGGFKLAIETEAIILPLAMTGTGAVWERRKNSKRCKVRAKILEPIDVKALVAENENLDPRHDLLPMVRSRIEEAL